MLLRLLLDIGYITLDRPPANNYDADGLDELARAIDAAAEDCDARVVVLRSAIERFFCAGADVRYLTEASVEDNLDLIDRFDRLVSFYNLDQINQAVADTERGNVIKAVLRMPEGRA